jgi:hypothetical protein
MPLALATITVAPSVTNSSGGRVVLVVGTVDVVGGSVVGDKVGLVGTDVAVVPSVSVSASSSPPPHAPSTSATIAANPIAPTDCRRDRRVDGNNDGVRVSTGALFTPTTLLSASRRV